MASGHSVAKDIWAPAAPPKKMQSGTLPSVRAAMGLRAPQRPQLSMQKVCADRSGGNACQCPPQLEDEQQRGVDAYRSQPILRSEIARITITINSISSNDTGAKKMDGVGRHRGIGRWVKHRL